MISPRGESGIQILSCPLLFPFRPQSAEQVNDWIIRHLPEGPKPPIYRPINYMRLVTITIAILGLVSFFSVAAPYIIPIIQNRNLWAAISLITILLFTSGHMFNHIRKVPYVAGDGKGGISYFAGGFSNQFGLETQIVAAMCMSTSHRSRSLHRLTCPRRHPFIRDNRTCTESATHGRSQEAADCSICMGRCYFRHVQLSPQRLPGQEWWLPIPLATVLVSDSHQSL